LKSSCVILEVKETISRYFPFKENFLAFEENCENFRLILTKRKVGFNFVRREEGRSSSTYLAAYDARQ
jgi:hypothetical protein